MKQLFVRFARRTSVITGSARAFILAVAVIVVWMVSGPVFHFSNTWQLVINTGTTIITFLMVFLIQNTQNRESLATQLKLDELIRAVELANNRVIDIEEGSDEQLEIMQKRFRHEAEQASAAGDDDAPNAKPGIAGAAAAEKPLVAHHR